MDEWRVDAFACGAHKGMLGPLGVGLLHVSPGLLDALDPLYVGPSGVTTLDKSGPQWRLGVSDPGDARRLETGNLNYPGIAGWAGALDLIEEAGPDRIEPWVLELSQALSEGLRALGAQVATPSGAESRSTTTALRVADPARRWRISPARWWPALWSMVTCVRPSAPITIMPTSANPRRRAQRVYQLDKNP